ncbi:MAG: ABC transporter permease [Parafilimonas sp.]|nr:ABC transporter permease [Parafilimonas sp.]
MLRNFFKTAFRNISKHKGFSFINIAGLTLGLTACILIGLFVYDEHQYDTFISDGDLVYRVYDEYTNSEQTQTMAVTSPMFATTLKQDFPEVEQTARVLMQAEYKALFEAGTIKLYESSGYHVDSTFFEVFPLSFKYGSSLNALNDISSIVISDEMAQRFFANQDPTGKQMLMDKTPYIIKGVFKKNPKFHLQFDYALPLAAAPIPADRMQRWGWHQFYTYAKLKKGTNVSLLEQKFQKEVAQKSKESSSSNESSMEKPFFQPLKNIHLYSSNFKFDAAQRGNITYVNALTIIAIFILLIACFNFVNLATAKSLQRAKEVGVRKSIGASRKQLIFQFMGETILMSCISIIISIMLAMLLLPWLNNFTGKNISLLLLINPVVITLFILLAFLVGLIAGIYPALVLSAFNAVKVLKGNGGNEEPGKIPWLRHGLVVIQFALSVLLIISAIVVFKQVDYLHNKDLGFNKEQVMFFPMRSDNMFKNADAFKNDLLKVPGVSSVSIGYGYPGDAVAGDEIIVSKNGQQVSQSATQITVDYDYIKTLGLQLVAGRDFSKAMSTDKDHAWIINETAVKELGFGTPQKALGKDLSWHLWGASNPDSLKTGKVIGVVKDFNYKSLYDKVETTVIQIFPDAAWKVAVKLKTAEASNTISGVKKVWNKYSSEYPIEYKFLDDNFQLMYTAEDKLKSLLWIFTAIAIFVGCLGLFGLAAYTAEKRRKEIGVRKVLGATTQNLVLLLSKDFIKLVVISFVIASPVAYYFMNKWLQDFAYRIHLSGWIFCIAAFVALSIAFATVSFQAIKAAIANPVKSLRTE